VLAALLLTWNGVAAYYGGNPLTMTQGYDGTQYQLLARNRLQGHGEVGDSAHTVRTEGCHPMWRPGLVWIQESLAHVLGSVRAAAVTASVLGTTVMELALLGLAWHCFGTATAALTLAGLVTPVTVSVIFLEMAVGQGPECWAAAAVLLGMLALVKALESRSWRWALAAGLTAGLSEWFRTGNTLLFAVPCVVYGLAALRRPPRAAVAVPVLALAAFCASAAAGGLTVPSRVNKNVANLWGNVVEYDGPRIVEDYQGHPVTYFLGGLVLVPGTEETYYDYVVRSSKDRDATAFLGDHGRRILARYREHLEIVVTSGARGLRLLVGDLLPACFVVALLLLGMRRDASARHTLALAGGALAHYLGPVVLLRGNDVNHYLFVLLPFLLVVGARGMVRCAELIGTVLGRAQPALAERSRRLAWFGIALAMAPLTCLSVSYYRGALINLGADGAKAQAEQAALDHLGLEGRRIACRRMSWFADRDVQTVLLPYALVPELESYVVAHDLDGILLWHNEPSKFFKASRYPTPDAFDRAMRHSTLFGQAQVSGNWQWYPVARTARVGRNRSVARAAQ
jgi:hypothetical protein